MRKRERVDFGIIRAAMNSLSILIVAAVGLLAPRDGAVVDMLPASQRAVLAQPNQASRRAAAVCEAGPWGVAAPLALVWNATEGVTGPWKIRIATDAALKDGSDYHILAKDLVPRYDGVCRYEVPRANLMPGRRYWWRVWGATRCPEWTCGSAIGPRGCACGKTRPAPASEVWSFTTADAAPRWIALEGRVENVRDLGGWRTTDGRRIRRGLAFRGQALNDDSVNGEAAGRNRLTAEDVRYLTETLGVKTDLDLRTQSEIADMKGSPLGPSVRFVHNSSLAYKEIFIPEGKEAMARNVRLFCDRANLPVFFHCIGGADRTGSLAYVLNGVCGVGKEDLERDWESTFYPDVPEVLENASGVPFSDSTYWRSSRHFDEGFAKYPGATLKDRIEAYLVDCGVMKEEIEKLRSVLVEESGQ